MATVPTLVLFAFILATDTIGAFPLHGGVSNPGRLLALQTSMNTPLRRPRAAVSQAYRRQACVPMANAGGDLEDDARIIRQAKAWVRDVVVKLRLCPFAEAVFNARRGVRYVVTPAETTDEVWREFLLEVDFLMDHDREDVGTTLLIAPRFLSDFREFNDFCRWLEETIEDDEALVDQVLVACFHPRHAFHGLEQDDVLNYEKRSPHPTINLLRADMVDEYIAMGRTLGIAEHNERRLHQEGKNVVKAAFEATLALE
ncbi:unnamed protein product [Ectocarpus sp. 6 AP-2014]